jgi:hypothetical protein
MRNSHRCIVAVGNHRSIAEAIILAMSVASIVGAGVYLWLGY